MTISTESIPRPRSSAHRWTSAAAHTPPPSFVLFLVVVVAPVLVAYSLMTGNEWRVLACVLAGMCGVAIVTWPFFGLVVFISLLYMRPEETFKDLAGMHLPLIVALTTFAAAWVQFSIRKVPVVRNPLNACIIGFGIAGVLSAGFVGTTSVAVTDFGRLVLLVLLVLNLVRTPERYRTVVTTLIVFTAYLSLYSMFLYYSGAAMLYSGRDLVVFNRSIATGIFGDPNDLAQAIVGGLALALSCMRSRPGKTARIAYGLLCVVMVWAILLTNSRGGMLALLVVLGGFFLAFSRRRGVAIAAASVIVLGLLAAGPSRMRSFDSQEESANNRFGFWENGIHMLAASPLWGVGYGKYPDNNVNFTAHNSFVLCFGELGLPGYFCWMGCIYYGFRRFSGRRTTEESDGDRLDLLGARLALVGYLVAGFFLSRTYEPNMFLMMTLPVSQQIALEGAMGGADAPPQGRSNLGRELGHIALLCAGSILFIWLLIRVMY